MLSKVIATTHYRRPHYSKQVLDALLGCYGSEDYRVLISQDFDPAYEAACNEVTEVLNQFSAARPPGMTELIINNPRYGIDLNKLFILPKAFELSDYVIFLEDDTFLSKDALRFFEFCGNRFQDDQGVVAVCAYHRYLTLEQHRRVLTKETYDLAKAGGFSPWGWAMWSDRYARKMGDGAAYKECWGDEANGRFDWWFNTGMDPGEGSVYPVLPRANHIGGEQAEHTPSLEWLMANEFAPFGAWTQEMPDPPRTAWRVEF